MRKINNVIIHSYSTDGYLPWAKVLVSSLDKVHPDIPIIMDTRNCNKKQINRLNKMHKNIRIDNKPLPLDIIAERGKVSIDTVKEMKAMLEGRTNYLPNKKKNIFVDIYKKYISVEDRYRICVRNAVLNNPGKLIISIDVDSCVTKSLAGLIRIVKDNHVSAPFRKGVSNPGKRVLGCLLGFKAVPDTTLFLDAWADIIDRVPLHKKIEDIRFGQSSFYTAYLKTRKKLSFGTIPPHIIRPVSLNSDVIQCYCIGKWAKIKNIR